ncbi:hypothetical protein ADUPG1_002845, partial [Aduncisulcus paluster]
WRREKEEDLPDSEMVRMSQRYIMATREAARKAQDQSLERREQKAPKVSFKVGDMVLVTFPEGPPTKQSPRWKGPWKISKIVSPWRSEIVNLDGHDAEIVGNDRLRTVVLREQEGELLKVQSRDNDEWEVDRIVSHMYGSKKPIRFKVK